MFWQDVGVATANNITAIVDNAVADGPDIQEEVRESGISCFLVMRQVPPLQQIRASSRGTCEQYLAGEGPGPEGSPVREEPGRSQSGPSRRGAWQERGLA